MPDESSNKLPDLPDDSDPQGAEAVSASTKRGSIEPELLERMEEIARVVAVSEIRHERHSGPMPSPAQLAEYENVLPGTAKIIRDEFQANSAHVRVMESKAVEYTKQDNVDNRKVAERLVWAALGATVLLALTGHDWVAGTVAVSTVGAVVTGFLNKRSDSGRQQGADVADED